MSDQLKVFGAGPFLRNYKPYLDQTCLDDASKDGHYQMLDLTYILQKSDKVKVLGADPFPSNYKPYPDQTCMDDASRDGHY